MTKNAVEKACDISARIKIVSNDEVKVNNNEMT